MTLIGRKCKRVVKKYLLGLISIFALCLPVCADDMEEYKCDLMIKGYEFTNDGLSEAIIKKDKEAVELFVKTDLNINMADTEGYSALDRAIKTNNVEAVALIAQAGGETKKLSPEEIPDFDNKKNIEQAEKPSVEIPELIAQKDNQPTKTEEKSSLTKFCEAVNANNLEEAEKMAETSEEINLLSDEGLAPLHYAIFNNNIEMVKLLLKHGADANVLADDGMTPLDITALNNQKEIAQILLENGGELSENVAGELEKFGCPMKYDEELDLYQASFDNIFNSMNKIQQKIENEKK